jgi:hypothetical protein
MKQKILIISPDFFQYTSIIIGAAKNNGLEPIWWDARPSKNSYFKALLKFNPKLAAKISQYHFMKKIDAMENCENFAYVLVIKGDCFNELVASKLRRKFQAAKFILYHWDSLKNVWNGLALVKYFNKVASFDRTDCRRYNIEYQPLFSSQKKLSNDAGCTPAMKPYQVTFVGTLHSDRLKVLSDFCLFNPHIETKFYVFTQHWIKDAYYKLIRYFKGYSRDIQLSPQKLNYQDYLHLISSTDAVLDIEHADQHGVTMRCFETIFQNQKLITTNQEIKNLTIYDNSRISIVNRLSPVVPEDFFEIEFSELTPSQVLEFSVDGWFSSLMLE